MVDEYAESYARRKEVLDSFPYLLQLAYEAIRKEALNTIREFDARCIAPGPDDKQFRERVTSIVDESDIWMRRDVGISYTSAHEIISSEFKFRSLIWCIETIRDQNLHESVGLTSDNRLFGRRTGRLDAGVEEFSG
jgi:hypothetical protein